MTDQSWPCIGSAMHASGPLDIMQPSSWRARTACTRVGITRAAQTTAAGVSRRYVSGCPWSDATLYTRLGDHCKPLRTARSASLSTPMHGCRPSARAGVRRTCPPRPMVHAPAGPTRCAGATNDERRGWARGHDTGARRCRPTVRRARRHRLTPGCGATRGRTGRATLARPVAPASRNSTGSTWSGP